MRPLKSNSSPKSAKPQGSAKPRSRKGTTGGPGHWRGTLLCLVASLLIGLACLPAISSLVARAMLAVPPRDPRLYDPVRPAIEAHPDLKFNWGLWSSMARGTVTEELATSLIARHPDNILPTYSVLLTRLRGSAATQPAGRQAVEEVCSRILAGPALRLRVMDNRRILTKALQRAGRSPRSAWALTEQVRWGFEGHAPVLRELADRLAAVDTPLAHQVVVRMLTDALADAPTHDVAMLVCPRLGRSLRALGEQARAERIENELMPLLREVEAPGVIPYWSGPLLCSRPHWLNVRLSLAGGLLLLLSLVLALPVIWSLALLVGGRFRDQPAEPLQRVAGAWRGALLVAAGPLLMLLGLLASPTSSLPWLCSERSLTGLLLLPGGVFLGLQLAGRLMDRESGRPLLRSVGVPAAIAVILAVAAVLIVPVHPEPWRPPAGLQLFRRAGLVLGWLWLIESLVLAFAGWRDRRRRGHPQSGRQLALAVAGRALLIVMLVLAPTLVIGGRIDSDHERAFLRAVERPLENLGRDGDTRIQSLLSGLRSP